jgi:hypothetical protein
MSKQYRYDRSEGRYAQGELPLGLHPAISGAHGTEEVFPESCSTAPRAGFDYGNRNRKQASLSCLPWGEDRLEVEILVPDPPFVDFKEAGEKPLEELIGTEVRDVVDYVE